jgi:hypothetical protein
MTTPRTTDSRVARNAISSEICDAAEQVPAVARLDAEQEVPADPAPPVQRKLRAQVDLVVVGFVGRVSQQLDDERSGEGHDDEEDDHDPPDHGHLVALEPHPGDLAEGTALDGLAAQPFEGGLRRCGCRTIGDLEGSGHAATRSFIGSAMSALLRFRPGSPYGWRP